MSPAAAGRPGSLLRFWLLAVALCWLCLRPAVSCAADLAPRRAVDGSAHGFYLAEDGRAPAICVEPGNPEAVRTAAEAFAADVERVSGVKPRVVSALPASSASGPARDLILVGVAGHSPAIDRLRGEGRVKTKAIEGKWESAVTTVVRDPIPGVARALVIAGSDRRGAAFALFALSQRIGVSPWAWWADVPAAHRDKIRIDADNEIQREPSVRYRGIFLNDEDWGLRPWAAKKMDPDLGNIGPHAYAHIFELLLRLHANTLWPAMHPGTLPFNALPENAKLADHWGIVMGSSHSEALLRNNVGEWDEKRDGPWNYQVNSAAMNQYWDKRLIANGAFENYYTVGLRGVHDTGLEATGSAEVKARLVEQVLAEQRDLLRKRVHPEIADIPQVIWLYKESLELYRAGMKVPDDVTLGWTDDNYGYLRQLPNASEQRRPGGSAVYYHVSYWGFPHDYLWLCSTPPALIREEMAKAWDHGARRYWVLNVGDIKPAEADIEYFLQLAADEPRMAHVGQREYLRSWAAEQFPPAFAERIADVLDRYYALNFVRKPEFMGFNGYDDGINRTAFNPLAWGDQNRARVEAWGRLRDEEQAIAKSMPPEFHDAFFELVAYPVEAAAAQNEKFLFTDRSFLDASRREDPARASDAAHAAYDRVQALTAEYNSLAGGKWDGMMSSAPRDRQVFKMPRTATAADAATPLPASWGPGDNHDPAATGGGLAERDGVVSINAAHFARKRNGPEAEWSVLPDLGISGASVVYGAPGSVASWDSATHEDEPWLEYEFATSGDGKATLELFLLPTFAVDSAHRLRYAVAVDGRAPVELDLSGAGEWHETAAPVWAANVLRNAAIAEVPLGGLAPGRHTLRFLYRDPGVVLEHLVVRFPGAAPAYPVPPETGR